MTLQELIEKGFIIKIETDGTSIGDGYKIYVKLLNYSIGSVVIDVGIDETLDDAIVLINKMVEVDLEIKNNKSQNIQFVFAHDPNKVISIIKEEK